MLKFLLDEQVSPRIAVQLTKRNPKLIVSSLQNWQGGVFLSANDEELLIAASTEKYSLVTYDLQTIPSILKTWSEQNKAHGGIVFIDEKTLRPNDIGGLVLALEKLWLAEGDRDWTNVSVYLTP
jgi:hypothetical protein